MTWDRASLSQVYHDHDAWFDYLSFKAKHFGVGPVDGRSARPKLCIKTIKYFPFFLPPFPLSFFPSFLLFFLYCIFHFFLLFLSFSPLFLSLLYLPSIFSFFPSFLFKLSLHYLSSSCLSSFFCFPSFFFFIIPFFLYCIFFFLSFLSPLCPSFLLFIFPF